MTEITFDNKQDMAKAFNALIHGKFTIVGIDLDVIDISDVACAMLREKGIKFKEIEC